MRGCGINPLGYPHHNEHLAPVCVLMDIPLLLTDDQMAEQVQRLYPGLRAEVVPWEEFAPPYLFRHYDALFRSDIWDTHQVRDKLASLSELHGKAMRTVHCPHGWSDKTFWFEQVRNEDIILLYGQSMLDLLRERGALEGLNGSCVTGNLRHQYYLHYQKAFDQRAYDDVFAKFERDQALILYAPTWYAPEQSSSFYEALPGIVNGLPDDHNLLIKLHPELVNDDIAKLYAAMAEFGNKPNVQFLEDYPLIYPLLNRADIYVGDTSSIGYDYLAFQKPMYFLNQELKDPTRDRDALLFRCGTTISPQEYPNIHTIIHSSLGEDQARFGEIREELYAYSFAPARPWNELRKELEGLIAANQAI